MVSPSAISRVTGVEAIYKNFNQGNAAMLPQRVSIIGVGNDDADYDTRKREIFSASDVANIFGWGSPLHLASQQFFPSIGKTAEFPVTLLPLEKSSSAIAATGAIGAEGTAIANGSGVVYIGGVPAEFPILKDSTAEEILLAMKNAINGELSMPAKAGEISDGEILLTAKWSGEIGNSITVKIEEKTPGVIFDTMDFSGGAIDPDVTQALEKIGPVWETILLNTFSYKNSNRLDKYQLYGEGRWGPLSKMPCIVAHGCVDDYETRTAISDARPEDYINFLITSVGSRELPFVIAAKGLMSDIATTANINPPQNYKGRLMGLHCGEDEAQEDYNKRNASIMKGASNNIKTGSVAELNDIVTFYHPQSQGKYPAKRYVVDLVKLMNTIYNVRLLMEADELKGAPLVSDETITDNPTAVCPKMVMTYFYNLADSLALAAIIQEQEFTKENMTVEIDKENPKRLNVTFPVKLSGNVEVSDSTIYFGFYVGGNK